MMLQQSFNNINNSTTKTTTSKKTTTTTKIIFLISIVKAVHIAIINNIYILHNKITIIYLRIIRFTTENKCNINK